jgi:hypothetical protein
MQGFIRNLPSLPFVKRIIIGFLFGFYPLILQTSMPLNQSGDILEEKPLIIDSSSIKRN